ncbi:CvpA family protein [Hymenobacter sp. AT01-02]|uniref:CvpA family protein n=1 Tax=Hymenobacter sp. AT01-02 TaxID=1571877 RepID=UPI0006E24619|nr:CvpA family protein [Hymenobacter sp. AT01-02]
MSGFDVLLLLPLGIGAIKGYRRGLVLEVASLVAFVLGVVGGLALLSDAIPLVRDYVGEASDCYRSCRLHSCLRPLCGVFTC